MFNYLNELNAEVEKAEEAIAELKAEAEKFRGQVRVWMCSLCIYIHIGR